MSQWHVPAQPDELSDISQLATFDAGQCFDLASGLPSFEDIPDAAQLSVQDHSQALEYNDLVSGALTPLQSYSGSNSIRGSLPQSLSSSNGIALYDQAPIWFPTGLEDESSVLRFDGLHKNDNQGEWNHADSQHYSETSNTERVEEGYSRFQHTSLTWGVPGENGMLVGHMPRQNARISDYHVQPSLPRRRSSWTAADSLDPMQRWQESPPEDEQAFMSAIYNALKDRTLNFSAHNAAAQENSLSNRRGRNLNSFRGHRRAACTTSFDSAASSSSRQSGSSAKSATSAASQGPYPRLSRTARERMRANRRNIGDKQRIFQCTFCCDNFKHKYDWTRHEKSLHLNMEEWRCVPHGSSVVLAVTGRVHCAYCNVLDLTPEHPNKHNHQACQGDSAQSRVFRRKNHLVQHLRLVHRLDTLPLIDDWKVESLSIASRCGFCGSTMTGWEERTDHLAAHFRKGSSMSDWRGDHGFDPSVAARVTNAMPPYPIGTESQSFVPFSATSPASKDHFNQISSQIGWPVNDPVVAGHDAAVEAPLDKTYMQQLPASTKAFTEILTLHLSRYAQQQMRLGIIPTDEMFQQESRRVLYDCKNT